jgi:hypothetical protein
MTFTKFLTRAHNRARLGHVPSVEVEREQGKKKERDGERRRERRGEREGGKEGGREGGKEIVKVHWYRNLLQTWWSEGLHLFTAVVPTCTCCVNLPQ